MEITAQMIRTGLRGAATLLAVVSLLPSAFADPAPDRVPEGLYQIQADRPGFVPDRLIVLDTQGSQGAIAAFSSSSLGTSIYSFNHLVTPEDSSSSMGISTDPRVPRSVELRFDSETGSLNGTIRDSRSAAPLEFTGTLLSSPRELIRTASDSPAALAPDERCAESPAGTYSGSLNAAAGTLTISALAEGRLAATFSSSGITPFRADFNARFSPRDGVLNLVHENPDGSFLKLALACSEQGRRWSGLGYATLNGASYPAAFEVKP